MTVAEGKRTFLVVLGHSIIISSVFSLLKRAGDGIVPFTFMTLRSGYYPLTHLSHPYPPLPLPMGKLPFCYPHLPLPMGKRRRIYPGYWVNTHVPPCEVVLKNHPAALSNLHVSLSNLHVSLFNSRT